MNEDLQDKTSIGLTEEIPEWKLRLAYFYSQNRTAFKRGLWFLFFFVDLLIILSLGLVFVNYQSGQLKEKYLLKELTANLIDHQTVAKNRPRKLINGGVKIVTAEQEGRVNLLVKITNPNDAWAVAELKYSFIVDGHALSQPATFILPKSEKYLMAFNVKRPQTVTLRLDNIRWQKIKDFSLISYKNGIEVKRAEFIPATNKLFSGTSLIEVYNNTPYDFWEVGLSIVAVDRQGRPLAVNYTVLNKFMARSTRQINITWREKIKERVYDLKVEPEINLLNDKSIMRLDSPNLHQKFGEEL